MGKKVNTTDECALFPLRLSFIVIAFIKGFKNLDISRPILFKEHLASLNNYCPFDCIFQLMVVIHDIRLIIRSDLSEGYFDR